MSILVLYDTETTGLNPAAGDDICQFAAVVHRQGEPVENTLEVSTLANPGKPIPPDAGHIHGITDADVANAPPAEEIVRDFWKEIIDFAAGDVIILGGHNTEFDLRFLEKHVKIPNTTRHICTMRLARRYEPTAKNHKLEYLYREFYKLPSHRTLKAHDALSDVWMSFELLQYWMTTKNKRFYAEVAAELLEPVFLETMPFGKHKGTAFSNLPQQYLKWLANQIDGQMDADVLHTARAYCHSYAY